MRIIELALKDLSQIFRDKKSLLFLVAMPIIFTLFMGFAYKGTGDSAAKDTRIPLGWVNHDGDGILSARLHDLLASSDAVRLVELGLEAAPDAVRKGEVSGALIVPAGFSQQMTRGPVQLKLMADPASADGQALFQLLRAPVTQLMSSVEIAGLSAETVGKSGDPAELAAAFADASQAWSSTDSGGLVQVEQVVGPQANKWYGDNPYNQASPGILVQFAIFGLVTSGQILVQERKSRTLQRMMTTAMRRWEIIAGHMLAMFAVVFVQGILLIAFAQLVLHVNYASELLGNLLVMVGLGLWVAAVGLLIGVLARGDDQVVLFSLIAMFVFSALGGTWFPLEDAGGAYAAIGRLMPSASAMTGFQNTLIRGLGFSSALLPTVVLLAYAAGFFTLAVWRFRSE
jgi:ABC-2 type transport system permease protein